MLSFEFKSGDEILSLCNSLTVRFSRAVGNVLSLRRCGSRFDPGKGGFFFKITFLIFIAPARYHVSFIFIYNVETLIPGLVRHGIVK